MSRRLRRWGRLGRGFRLVGGRLWCRLRRGVILRRRRDDDHHRRKILGGRRKRRANGDQRKRSNKSNGVRLHRSVSCSRFARRAARPTDALARGENPIWSRPPTQFAVRGARCASERRLASLDRSETISAHRPEGPFEALSYHILRKKGNSPIAARKMKATRISRVHGPRRSQQANGRANIIATRRLPGGQPQQRMWRGGRDAAITSAPELARAARLPPSGRRAGA
jgi:hypothetical protein